MLGDVTLVITDSTAVEYETTIAPIIYPTAESNSPYKLLGNTRIRTSYLLHISNLQRKLLYHLSYAAHIINWLLTA